MLNRAENVNGPVKDQGIWCGAFIRLVALELLVQFGTTFVNPITSNYAVAMGATVALAGFLTGLNAVVSCVFRPLGGFILQSAPRKLLLIIAIIAFAFATILSAVFSSVLLLGISRVIMGLAFIIKSTLVISLTSAIIPSKHLGQGVGVIGLSTIIASAVGPGIGSYIGLSFGYNVTFLISGMIFSTATIIALFIKDPEEHKKATPDKQNSESRQDSRHTDTSEGKQEKISPSGSSGAHWFDFSRLFYFRTFPLAGITVLEACMYGSATGLVLLVGEQRGISQASIFFFSYALVAVVSRLFVTRMYDAYGLKMIFIPTVLLMCASMLSLAFAQNVVLVAVGGMFLALGQGGLYPCLQAESVRGVPKEKASLAVNTFYIGADAGMAIGPFLSGAVLQMFGSFTMFMLNCCIGIVLLLSFFPYFRWKQKSLPDNNPVLQQENPKS